MMDYINLNELRQGWRRAAVDANCRLGIAEGTASLDTLVADENAADAAAEWLLEELREKGWLVPEPRSPGSLQNVHTPPTAKDRRPWKLHVRKSDGSVFDTTVSATDDEPIRAIELEAYLWWLAEPEAAVEIICPNGKSYNFPGEWRICAYDPAHDDRGRDFPVVVHSYDEAAEHVAVNLAANPELEGWRFILIDPVEGGHHLDI